LQFDSKTARLTTALSPVTLRCGPDATFFEPFFWQPFFGNTARSVVVTVYKQGNCGALTAKIAKILLFF
jgi:hypothetical protein